MHGSPPTLESFDQVLDGLARDPRIAPHSPEWIRESVVAGGEKVRILQYILDAHPPGGSPPRVLDIGTNIGSFALLAAKHGCRVSALDYASYADIYAKIHAEQGVEFRACDLAADPLPFEDNSFDFVTYTDVIEHHAFSPRPVLREIHRVLVPGGRVIILTPNQASIYNRLMLLFGRSIYGVFDHFFDSTPDRSIYLGHHHEFTRAELSAALERTGFKVLESRVIEEDLASMLYFRRRYPERVVPAHNSFLLVRAVGPIWSFLHLDFGRVLWAVGEKPRIQNP
jgi:SAM-dependent methyltransferase